MNLRRTLFVKRKSPTGTSRQLVTSPTFADAVHCADLSKDCIQFKHSALCTSSSHSSVALYPRH
ncbi:hypothetical protein PISMIDRAFT_685141 [Pisolithus microcarpus 441]|uniref:Unplaced genomic scaffold scaffold_140, whole genome shotgun sequence n=1 Tax=Pisolithus microcarpus 441 TaxID=765257 RepID=A0A0C9ZC68_9AGAM|nr:hypothetical protein PISMIDRAFT_685141 [Pisolithus microcarpus 441]